MIDIMFGGASFALQPSDHLISASCHMQEELLLVFSRLRLTMQTLRLEGKACDPNSVTACDCMSVRDKLHIKHLCKGIQKSKLILLQQGII